MRKGILVFALLVLIAGVADAAPAGFAGTWKGHWHSDPPLHQFGSVEITVDADGTFRGPISNDFLGLQGVLSGKVEPDGTTTLRYSYDGGATTNTGGGRFRHDHDRIVGNVEFRGPEGENFGTGTFELTDATTTAL